MSIPFEQLETELLQNKEFFDAYIKEVDREARIDELKSLNIAIYKRIKELEKTQELE